MTKENNKGNEQSNGMPLEIYSNSVEFALSLYDIALDFGVLDAKNLKKRHSLVKVKMSPQHAKVMSILLARNMEKYEKDIGEIKIPEAFIKEKIRGDK